MPALKSMLLLFHTAFTPVFGTAPLNLTHLVRIRNLAHNPFILTNHGHGHYPKNQKKMEPIATWEKLLLGVLALLVILWFSPGINKMMGVSRDAKSDWIGLAIPIAMVCFFVFLLILII